MLLAVHHRPAEHWVTVQVRTRATMCAATRAAGPAVAFKLNESTRERWRAVNAPRLLALVRAGVRFERGAPIERGPAVAS